MEQTILYEILAWLAPKAVSPKVVYGDQELARGVLAYIRSEALVRRMEGLDRLTRRVYLEMQLHRFRDMDYPSVRYFFLNRELLEQLADLVAWFREGQGDPALRRERAALLRELAARLPREEKTTRIAREALHYASHPEG